MLQDYFRIAIRHLMKGRVYATINLVGLAVGMAASFLIVQYVSFQVSYDRYHKNSDRIFRVAYTRYENGELKNSSAGTFFGVGPYLTENFPEVESVVRFYKWPANTGAVLLAENKVFNERNYFFAEPSFFQVFSSLLLRGNAENCLTSPNSIVLSRRLAIKMFESEDVLGKVVARLDRKNWPLTVTGIMRDIPENSHFDLDLVIPFDEDWRVERKDYWKYPNEWTYLTLKRGFDAAEFEEKLNTSLRKDQHLNPAFDGASLIVQPITAIHFTSHLKDEIKTNGSADLTYGVGLSALIILLIAWINYVNLETSKYLARIREVAVRRIIGSSKSQLIFQFFVQYVCLSATAVIFAIMIVYGVMPYYPALTGVPTVAIRETVAWIWISAGIFFTVGGFITGIYPALFLIKFNPVSSLKGKLGNMRGSFLKRALLTFQFVASMALLAFLLVIYQQLEFIRSSSRNLALDRVLTIYNTTSYTIFEDTLKKEKSLGYRNKILQYSNFKNVTTSSAVPGEPIGFTYHNLTKRSLSDADDDVPYKVMFVDYHFLPVFGLKLKAGRNYAENNGEDNNLSSIVLNESAIHALGFSSAETALNQEIYFMVTFDWKKYRIIGIVEDYSHESVKAPVYPTIFFLHRYVGQMTYYSLLIDKEADVQESLALAEKTWSEIWPEKSFDYFFMDRHYDQQYKSEIYFGRIFALFAGIALFLACLGVLGATLFEANARLKEISIRKVLGASVTGLVTLLSRGYAKTLVLATGVAVPLIYSLATRWLSNYPIRIELSAYYFLLPLLVIVVLVSIASGFQMIKAANTNPVTHLKNE